MTNLNFPGAVQDIKASQDFLRNEGSKKIAVVGFCMGGALALAAAGLIPSLNAA
jgi:carboxymethylenebutenolidase